MTIDQARAVTRLLFVMLFGYACGELTALLAPHLGVEPVVANLALMPVVFTCALRLRAWFEA